MHAGFETENGEKLGIWISSQRYSYSKSRLDKERIEALEQICMSWQRDKGRWAEAYEQAVQYYSENGNIDMPVSYVNSDGFKLGT